MTLEEQLVEERIGLELERLDRFGRIRVLKRLLNENRTAPPLPHDPRQLEIL
jgi:hypothetical protein